MRTTQALRIINKMIGQLMSEHSKIDIESSQCRAIFQKMDQAEKNEVIQVLKACLPEKDDIETYMMILFVLWKCLKEPIILKEILNTLAWDGRFQPFFRARDYVIFLRTNEYEPYFRIIRKQCAAQLRPLILEKGYSYRKLAKRNLNRVVIITEQLLPLAHAPSKVILDRCIGLHRLGKEVYLIVLPTQCCNNDIMHCYCQADVNYSEQYNGEKKLEIHDGIEITSYQQRIGADYLENLKSVFRKIYEWNPAFVLNIGTENPLADIADSFVTEVAESMDIKYPLMDNAILIKNGSLEYKGIEEDRRNITPETKIWKHSFTIKMDDVSNILTREELKLPQEKFIIAVVGNRLNQELTLKVLCFLQKVTELDEKIVIATIGTIEKKLDSRLREKLKNR
ncbi:MAG: hypothetical protein RSD28_06255, partial [Lachnospiraceae bacterium]